MEAARIPENENQRLDSLRSLNILDTLPEADFDQITFLASQICGTSIALISLIDENRQWFKSQIGIGGSETSRDLSFCAHAILNKTVMLVPDTSKDARFFDHPSVTGEPNIHFYAGAPLMSPDGYAIGTICVADSKPMILAPEKVKALEALSNQVTKLLELKEQVEALRFKTKAAETIGEGVVLQDKTGAIVDFNPSALGVFKLTEDQLLGKTSMDSGWRAINRDGSDFPGEKHPAMVCLRTGKVQKGVVLGIRLHSDTRWLMVNSAPIISAGEKLPSHVVTTFADITEQVLAEEMAERKRLELRLLLDSIPHMIAMWDTNEINLQANQIYSDFFNKTPEQMKGMSIRELLGQDLYLRNQAYIRKVLSGERVSFERSVTHKDGSVHHMLASYVPNFLKGKLVSFLAISMDITDLRNSENDLRVLESKLADANKLTALGEMAAGLAHEVNNPVTIIKGQAGILLRKIENKTVDTEMMCRDLKLIEKTSDRISKIINSLQLFSRNASNDSFQKTNLVEAIESTLELCHERFKQASIDIRLKLDSSIFIKCRPAQISQVMMNLLSNAFDAISDLDKKWIEIKTTQTNGIVKVEVTDSGNGITHEVAQKMMQPFFTTKEVGKGTGLGLSISVGIIKNHGGNLIYDDHASHTKFVVTLPAF